MTIERVYLEDEVGGEQDVADGGSEYDENVVESQSESEVDEVLSEFEVSPECEEAKEEIASPLELSNHDVVGKPVEEKEEVAMAVATLVVKEKKEEEAEEETCEGEDAGADTDPLPENVAKVETGEVSASAEIHEDGENGDKEGGGMTLLEEMEKSGESFVAEMQKKKGEYEKLLDAIKKVKKKFPGCPIDDDLILGDTGAKAKEKKRLPISSFGLLVYWVRSECLRDLWTILTCLRIHL